MKIINKGRGIHAREVAGIDRLQKELPDNWIGFTNLELALPNGAREIDLIIIADDRILAVDLKDWHGKIESSGNAWRLNNRVMEGGNPVEKICDNRRKLSNMLTAYLKQQASKKGIAVGSVYVPKVEPCVVLTGSFDRNGIAPTEVDKVFPLDFFIKMLRNPKERVATLGPVLPVFYDPGLTTSVWMQHLNKFFSVDEEFVRASSRQYGPYRAVLDKHNFAHAKGIFSEYDVADASSDNASGLLRRWDFTKAEAKFQNEEGRLEIAGRERKVISWLSDRNADCDSGVLQPRVHDTEHGVGYWEVFERRRRLQRLSDLSPEQLLALPRDTRIELLRQVVLRVKQMHELNAAHLDIGLHSVWIETPSIARLSHLMAATYPDKASLGESRYQFLSSVGLPEDLLDAADSAQRKDVYLLGCVAHHLLFGRLPPSAQPGEPPEWDSAVDAECSVVELHDWLAQALNWEPLKRFQDAGEMLDVLNGALSTRPSAQQVLQGLEAFRTVLSQMKLWREFPVDEEICDNARVTIWISQLAGKPVLVKLWKSVAWGELSKEGPRLLAFLERADALRLDHPPGCAAILRPIWLGDALVLVQEYLEAPTLATIFAEELDVLGSGKSALMFLRTLCQTIITLHERQIAHGDLKPDNILVVQQCAQEQKEGQDALQEQSPQPVLIDLLDFSPADDGERLSTAYAPPSGGRFERDCFAITKIAEEMLTVVQVDKLAQELIRTSILQIRTSKPENATLLPLLEAIDVGLSPVATATRRRLTLVLPQDDGARFLTDEGKIGLVLARNGRKLSLRGAVEQIVVQLDSQFKFLSARRYSADQTLLSREAKFVFASLDLDVHIEPGIDYDLSALEDLLEEPDVALAWLEQREALTQTKVAGGGADSDADDDADDVDEGTDGDPSQEGAEDQMIEAVAQQEVRIADIDVPKLWSRLLELEADLTIGGTTTEPSYYKEQTQRHHVAFQVESGTFDFARDDTVTVSKLDRHARWVRIGHLDLANSTPSHLQITTRNRTSRDAEVLLGEAQQLRFESHFEVTSRQRRRAATQRVLARESRIRNLIDVFHPRKAPEPVRQEHSIDEAALMQRYGLNAVQASAFAKLVEQRPVGLLQGPPGTGKTRFIGALVHYALSTGLAKNVLLASQSHEAVNGAAEAVLRLFGNDEEAPSVLRVGHEGIVSEPLLPYHAARVEGLIKDRFKAELRTRLHVVGRALAIPVSLVDKLISVETTVRPVVERFLELQARGEQGAFDERISGLRDTLATMVETMQLRNMVEHAFEDGYLDVLVNRIAANEGFSNAAKLQSFRDVAELARDFIGSVSSRERSFETFLAGTRRIVAGTCVGLGRASLGLTVTPFDLVIVDEAARCTPGELAVPLQSGRWVVLVGDHQQLEPQHRAEVVQQVARELKIGSGDVLRSDFERVFSSAYRQTGGASLTQQYRMLPPIGEIVSNAFYKRKLTHGRAKPIIDLSSLPLALEKPLTWIATDDFGSEGFQREVEKRRFALENLTEAELIVGLIKRWDTDQGLRTWIEGQTEFPKAIGVICTYRAQSKLIQTSLRHAGLSPAMLATVKVDTVDSYQGKENPIVILSLTRNNEDGTEEDMVPTIREGFMAKPNRLNVAMSRAMDRLVLVGASKRWRTSGPMGDVAREFAQQVAAGQAEVINGVALKSQLEGSTLQTKQAIPTEVTAGEVQ